MFVQVWQGPVRDEGGALAALEDWVRHLGRTAEGWLGSTSGVTDDGTLVSVVRFTDEAAARRSSDRREHRQWWRRTAPLLTGDVTVRDGPDAQAGRLGAVDGAGFVQVIQGRATDRARLRALVRDMETRFVGWRPDLLGLIVATHSGGTFTQVAYFTTEDDARRGEKEELPDDVRAALCEDVAVTDDVTYLDLRRPVAHRPAGHP